MNSIFIPAIEQFTYLCVYTPLEQGKFCPPDTIQYQKNEAEKSYLGNGWWPNFLFITPIPR